MHGSIPYQWYSGTIAEFHDIYVTFFLPRNVPPKIVSCAAGAGASDGGGGRKWKRLRVRQRLGHPARRLRVLGTDLSQRACLANRATIAAHAGSCSGRSDVLGTESLLGLRPGAPFDVFLLNPPLDFTTS